MMPLTQNIGEIDELNDMVVHDNEVKEAISYMVQKIANCRDSWLHRLLEQLRYKPENLKRFSELGHGRPFIALYLGFHHHGQLLCHLFLHEE